MKNSFLTLAFLFVLYSAFAQLNIGGKPYSFNHSLKSVDIDIKYMPSFDANKMLQEDREMALHGNKSLRFAKSFEVNFDIYNSGTWINLADGSRLWQLGIYSKGAYSINVIFDSYSLPKGSKLYIYNLERTHVIGG
ncbi:MAG: hypothetical protein KAQ75_00335, partial [Bacteroidales bacterium]|nr:hypothetical protein [Bacteroidales bacterium]